MVKKWNILHPNSALGLINAHTIEKEKVFGYYYGSLIYADLIRERYKANPYGKGEIQMAAEIFRMLQNVLP